MTRDRRFKQAVRRRMRATGQNFLSARSSLQPRESADGGGRPHMASSTQLVYLPSAIPPGPDKRIFAAQYPPPITHRFIS